MLGTLGPSKDRAQTFSGVSAPMRRVSRDLGTNGYRDGTQKDAKRPLLGPKILKLRVPGNPKAR